MLIINEISDEGNKDIKALNKRLKMMTTNLE